MVRSAGALLVATGALLCAAPGLRAQDVTYRGFVEGRGVFYPQDAPNDEENAVGDILARVETFADLLPWLSISAGLDLRANTHDQVGTSWTPDLTDQGLKRPPLSVRRLSASLFKGPLTLDAGRQFIRWGRTDILAPTDRFAPRDYLNVIDADFLGVSGLRARLSNGFDTLDLVWVPIFTPGRLPLFHQRWSAPADESVRVVLLEQAGDTPERWQAGVRWERIGDGYEFAAAYYDGFNTMPVIMPAAATGVPGDPFMLPVVRRFPGQRMAGADAAVPTRWFTLKGEVAYFGARGDAVDDYVLYVVQVERQTGEWILIGGYAGEVVAQNRELDLFAPERELARSFVGRASYMVDSVSSIAFEGAVRHDADGLYVKAEYSRAHGQHWRFTISGALLAGSDTDFLGQYRRNSHLTMGARYSF